MSDFNSFDLRHLLNRVLLMSGFEYAGPDMCGPLASMISLRTGHQISEITLKRLYGFIPSKFSPSNFTIYTLIIFCGYNSWTEFLKTIVKKHDYIIYPNLKGIDLKKIFYYSTQAMWVFCTQNMRFLEVNEAACDIYGFTKKEFLERTILDIRPPEDNAKLLDAIKNADTFCYHAEPYRHLLANGDLIDVDVISYAFQWSDKPARIVLPINISNPKFNFRNF